MHFAARLQVKMDQAQREGPVRTLGRLLKHFATFVGWLALLPVAILLHVAGFRRVTVITERIGHLAAEVDCFLKEKALGKVAARAWFILAPTGRVANDHLLGYWREHIRVISNPILVLLLETMSRWLFVKHDVSHYVLRLNGSQEIYRINALWAGRPPILELKSEDAAGGAAVLRHMGLADGGWFVCVHVREPGFSPGDESAHLHRNGSIEAIMPALTEITRHGGWCIRMGDPSMTPLPPMDRVIDYAHHRLRSERMDVFLCARTRFFLGNSSGLALVSSAFGVPCALANMIPLSALAVLAGDLSIPKLLWREREARFLCFDEIMASPVGNYRYAKLYADAGIRPMESSAEDIVELVVEMLEKMAGTFRENGEDHELQQKLRALFRPGHYSYGAASQVGASFLRKYRYLLRKDASGQE